MSTRLNGQAERTADCLALLPAAVVVSLELKLGFHFARLPLAEHCCCRPTASAAAAAAAAGGRSNSAGSASDPPLLRRFPVCRRQHSSATAAAACAMRAQWRPQAAARAPETRSHQQVAGANKSNTRLRLTSAPPGPARPTSNRWQPLSSGSNSNSDLAQLKASAPAKSLHSD